MTWPAWIFFTIAAAEGAVIWFGRRQMLGPKPPLKCYDDGAHGPWTEWLEVAVNGGHLLRFRDCTRCGIRDRRLS